MISHIFKNRSLTFHFRRPLIFHFMVVLFKILTNFSEIEIVHFQRSWSRFSKIGGTFYFWRDFWFGRLFKYRVFLLFDQYQDPLKKIKILKIALSNFRLAPPLFQKDQDPSPSQRLRSRLLPSTFSFSRSRSDVLFSPSLF